MIVNDDIVCRDDVVVGDLACLAILQSLPSWPVLLILARRLTVSILHWAHLNLARADSALLSGILLR